MKEEHKSVNDQVCQKEINDYIKKIEEREEIEKHIEIE